MHTQHAESTPSRKKQNRRPSSARKQVYLTWEAHKLLVPAAEELEITAAEYASAAVTYFAQRGLDPVQNQEREGIIIQNKITELEKVVVALGNRLFGWLTQHERSIGSFLKGHEKTLFTYLQAQEANLHEHLAEQESSFLMPLMRELMVTNIEALYGRRLGEQIMLKVLDRDLNEYSEKHFEFNRRRDVDVQKKLDAFVKNLPVMSTPLSEKLPPTAIPETSKLTESAPAVTATNTI